ncbi:hypothetical protein EI427_18380 [Flammeovirga pectinis]|uniref:Uncharacterized protein n=1 Tax=Flammeovirga pectinis TaxID=2494373 RepID=A0A3Q9FR51_9BACT|nr:hypothetical protein [Flammeovirga kamogawensis]AZQ64119.1 hypothetical protein EI427_18380 [Flammeovirga pectinis]MBB6463731.1 hypothetical protein [Flammeovirga kamogawensis]TRX68060.1 hypothetical protein EO216_07880 [Flammeovirga kamogawensis]
MLEYSKIILKKVSFDRHLFLKELRKSLGILSINEVLSLRSWSKSTFPNYAFLIQNECNKHISSYSLVG